MVTIQKPWWNLLVTGLTVWEYCWMLFEYKGNETPVEYSEVVLKITPISGPTGAPWEQTLAGLHIGQ